jgi:hypothetical protein
MVGPAADGIDLRVLGGISDSLHSSLLTPLGSLLSFLSSLPRSYLLVERMRPQERPKESTTAPEWLEKSTKRAPNCALGQTDMYMFWFTRKAQLSMITKHSYYVLGEKRVGKRKEREERGKERKEEG